MPNAGDYVRASDIVGTVQSWTPALTANTSNPTLGSGSTAAGSYLYLSKRFVYVSGRVAFGAGGGAAAGSGFYVLSLPVAAASDFTSSTDACVMNVLAQDNSTGRYVHAFGTISVGGSTLVRIRFGDSGATTSATSFSDSNPWVWAAGDFIEFSGIYPVDAP